MNDGEHVALIGRRAELDRFHHVRRQVEQSGAGYLWVTGESGCGKSRFLQACASQAMYVGWEVLRGECTEETQTDPYGPFLSMFGLCFDKGGRLINDRSVYSIIDQISLDSVMDAVANLPGMSIVAFGVRVGMTIFESRRRPQNGDQLLNRNYEFILQLCNQVERRRGKPLLLALDDLHLASKTTYALIEYLLTRAEGTRVMVAATWQAGSPEEGRAAVRAAFPRLTQPDRIAHLSVLSEDSMRQLLSRFSARSIPHTLADTLIDFSRGLPGILAESVRLVELGGEAHVDDYHGRDAGHSIVQSLVARQCAAFGPAQLALLQCAALIGQRVPVNVLTAPPLCGYLGLSEREALSLIVEAADRGAVLAWDGDDAIRFTSAFVRAFLRDHHREALARRDHLRIAEAWQSTGGESHPAQLATHYLAGGDPARALAFALQSAEELSRSAAYPEAMQSYRLALEALEHSSDREDGAEMKYEILRAIALTAEQTGDWGESVSRLEEALDLATGDVAKEAEIQAGLGWIHVQRGEVQVALQHLHASAQRYESLGDIQGRAQVDYYLGVLYSRQKEWQRAVACFERYLRISEEAGFGEGRASAHIELGNLYRLQQDWPRAESLLQQGIDLAQAEGDYVVLAQGYHYLGNCYARQGNPDSIEVLQRALDIVKSRTKQPAQEASIQNTLGETLVRMSRWDEAEAAFQASAGTKERLGDRAGLAMTYGGLGRLYLRQWRFERAVECFQKDIELLADEPEANVAWIQQQTNWIGEALRLQGQLDRAEEHLCQAMVLAERIPDPEVRQQSMGYTHLLWTRLALDRVDLAVAEAEYAAAEHMLVHTWAEGELYRTGACLARARGDQRGARQALDQALALAERGEELDRALVFLEQAYWYRDAGDVEQVRHWAGQAAELARRLRNAELERRALEAQDAGQDGP